MPTPPFPGRIGRTVRDSEPYHEEPPHPGEDAPNVVVVVLDDTGFAQLGCFGSDIDTPNVDALAAPLARCAAPAGSVVVADVEMREDGVPIAGKVLSGTTDREAITCIEKALGRGAFLCTSDGKNARLRIALEWRAP